jgi:hypothetical protein
LSARIAFLLLGEMLLIPHLFPIAEALFGEDLDIDLWVSTSVHAALIGAWCAGLHRARVRVRHAPGFRRLAGLAPGQNPPLPPKLPMLAGLIPALARTDAVVCAEQTSLWLPALLPLWTPFVKTSHGVGSMSARDDPRRRAARLMLVPSERERATYLERGHDPARVVATGYVKAAFRHRTHTRLPFRERRPVVLYAPHWQKHRSSWWRWGPRLVERLAEHPGLNLVFAPHQRLAERSPEVRRTAERLRGRANVHCDLDSFATVDGSYTEAADIYLGDTSSQVVEFLARPRPCVFLNPQRVAWEGSPGYAQWACGEVAETLEDALAAVDRAPALHPRFRAVQAAFAQSSLGEAGGAAAAPAAREIMRLVRAAPRPARPSHGLGLGARPG